MFAHRSHRQVEMTAGPLLPNVLAFTVPLILSGVLQLLYNSADIIVVGRFADSVAMASVGATTSLIHLLVSMLMGLSVGASVAVARATGAGDRDGVRCAVHTSMALAVLSGVLLGALLLLLSAPLLELMAAPKTCWPARSSISIFTPSACPPASSITMARPSFAPSGDTKRPAVLPDHQRRGQYHPQRAARRRVEAQRRGVAIATIVSEFISAALVLASLITSHGDIRFEPKKTRVERRSLSLILRIGIPAGLQSSMFSISNVLIQSAINSFGAAAIAGNTAAASIEGFATTVSNSISQAALTFSSQNMGAEKYQRVRRVLAVCLAATLVGGLTLGLLIYAFGTPLLSLFNTDPDVIANGLIRVSHNMPLYVLFCMQDTFVGQLRGIGYSLLPTITSLSGICLLRVVWLYTAFAASPTLDTLYLSYPVSWAVTLAALVVCYAVVVRKLPKA